jgi:hypothetical protein
MFLLSGKSNMKNKDSMKKRFWVKQYHRGRWHVMDGNIPIYDDAPYGNDKPIIYKDEDKAIEVAARLNEEYENVE